MPQAVVRMCRIAVVILLLLIGPASAAFLIVQTAISGSGVFSFQTMKIGAGGQLTAIDIQCDQGVGQCNNSGTVTRVVRADTYGAWLLNNSTPNCGNATATGCWQQLVTATSMPDSLFGLQSSTSCCGVYEIRIAPSNTQVFYMYLNGYVYKSTNQGTTWTRTGFSNVAAKPNASTKLGGPYMAIDPANANIVFVGTPSSGVFYTTNGGTSWTGISTSTIAAGQTPSGDAFFGSPGVGVGNMIAFDPSSSVISNVTQGIYVCSWGTGCYHSTNAGSNWALTASTPTTFIHVFCDQNGTLWTETSAGFGGTPTNLYAYLGGTWTAITDGSPVGRNTSVAVNPNTAGSSLEIVVGQDWGGYNYSSNNGSTWISGTQPPTRTATDIPWLANTKEAFMTNGGLVFDPSSSNLLYLAEGIGVWYGNATGTNIAWTSRSAAIEQLVADWIVSPAGGTPLVTAWDRPVFVVSNPNLYPSNHGVNYSNAIIKGSGIDWVAGTPATVVVIADWFGTETSGISTDGGSTWTTFAAYPSGTVLNGGNGWAGCIAAGSTSNFVWVLSDDGGVFYTTNSGSSWFAPSYSTGISNTDTGWNHAYYYNRENCVADRVNANTFYIYNSGSAAPGIYRSTNSGATFTRVVSGAFSGGPNVQMRSAPGEAGVFYYTSGNDTPTGTQAFYECVDTGTVTCSAVAGVTDVWAFGFGKAQTGQSYPTIYFYGEYNGTFGMWRDDAHHSTFTQLSGEYVNGSQDQVVSVEGDNNTYGTVYVGFQGSGYAYGQFNYLLSRDLNPANDNDGPAWLNQAA